jgi:cytochrome c oxidase subunit 2
VGLTGCNTEQSVLAPRGPHAEAVDRLGDVMVWGGVVIFALVVALTAAATLLPPRWRRWMGRDAFIATLGIGLPVVALSALLVWGLGLTGTLAAAGPPALRIEVTGEMWWWRVAYVDGEGNRVLETANEIHIPVGEPVEFVLTSPDVIHSFWIPALAGKLDMIPGRTNRTTVTAGIPGVYRGQCAEYCGDMHALMAFKVVSHELSEFEAWFSREAAPAAPPAGVEAQHGAVLFAQNGCGACHTVRGTEANGGLGPDLTHIGSRLTIGAGSFPRNVGTLAGWIASAQHLKPGNKMPSFDRLSGPELRAIAAYLEGLK